MSSEGLVRRHSHLRIGRYHQVNTWTGGGGRGVKVELWSGPGGCSRIQRILSSKHSLLGSFLLNFISLKKNLFHYVSTVLAVLMNHILEIEDIFFFYAFVLLPITKKKRLKSQHFTFLL